MRFDKIGKPEPLKGTVPNALGASILFNNLISAVIYRKKTPNHNPGISGIPLHTTVIKLPATHVSPSSAAKRGHYRFLPKGDPYGEAPEYTTPTIIKGVGK